MGSGRLIAFALIVLSAITGGAIFGIMSVSFGDVVARMAYRPISGAYELTEMLVGLMVFSALPIVTYQGKHVTVTFLRGLMEKSVVLKVAVIVFSRAVTALVLAYLGLQLWALGIQFAQTKAIAAFAGVPMAPFAYFAAGMCFLAAVFSAIRPNVAPVGEEL
jgi:TRAP-type transport system small permease protein